MVLIWGSRQLIHTQEHNRLSTWVNNARNYVSEDKEYLEKNAKLLLTTWVAPSWQNYARREWSGLIGDFYRNRWNEFFSFYVKSDFIQEEFNDYIFEWANNWCGVNGVVNTKSVSVLKEAKRLIELGNMIYSTIPQSWISNSKSESINYNLIKL